uniref:Uncharacterized protein n=1 Tax=Medicago truncatula TaxID=3880 RepID=I3T5H8_MEDTR|nr:unknown [Medicago truncatula]
MSCIVLYIYVVGAFTIGLMKHINVKLCKIHLVCLGSLWLYKMAARRRSSLKKLPLC